MTATLDAPIRRDLLSMETRLAALDQESREAALDGLDPQALQWSWNYKGRVDQLEATHSEAPVILFVGGRGIGKNRTGSEWIRDKIERKPPGKKLRFALASRTTADVRDTIINGDSGIMSVFPPGQKPVYIGHLRIVRFYDGSEALCFSSQEPDQLRGVQFDYCFPAGTMIHTPTGERPIETISAGEQVITRYGARRVRSTGNRQSVLTKMTHSTGELVGSPEHPVWTTRGWIRLDSLLPGDILFSWANGTSARMVDTSATRVIRESGRWSCAVGGSGSNTTDRSRRAVKFTTGITTTLMIASRIWNVTLLKSMLVFTPLFCELLNVRIARPNSKFLPGAAGTLLVGASSVNTNVPGLKLRPIRAIVRNASSRIKQRIQRANIAVLPAAMPLESKMYPETSTGRDWLKSPANGAARNEWPDERSASVVLGVETVSLPPVTVYNLEVEEHPEFFASGVLVHNSLSDEIAAWEWICDDSGLTAWDNLRIATRLGDNPQIFAATTPRRVPAIRDLFDEAKKTTRVQLVTGASTFDNPYLSPAYMETILGLYQGTRLSQQELFGILLGDVEGALWSMESLDQHRLDTRPIELPMCVIGVDPSVSENPRDECGIVVAMATGHRSALKRHAYVIADLSVLGPPSKWAHAVVNAARTFRAPIVAERNQGGALIKEAIHTIDPTIRVRTVWAKKNKKLRAEPVLLAHDQGRIHHVGRMMALEDQLTTWLPEDSDSPDRLDAYVYALSALVVPSSYKTGVGAPTVKAARGRIDLGREIAARRRVW